MRNLVDFDTDPKLMVAIEKNTTLNTADIFEFPCVGVNTVLTTFYKNGNLLEISNDVLRIDSVAKNDTGIFSCKIMNEHGISAEFTTELVVNDEEKVATLDQLGLTDIVMVKMPETTEVMVTQSSFKNVASFLVFLMIFSV